jgi:anti-anti-sigma factor
VGTWHALGIAPRHRRPTEGRENMDNAMERHDEMVIVKPKGKLSVREGQELLAAIFAEVEPMPRDVIVDLSGVNDVSSWGFALICGLARKLAQMGHSLRIAGPTPFVKKYLELFTTQKDPVEFYGSREEALRESRGGRRRL